MREGLFRGKVRERGPVSEGGPISEGKSGRARIGGKRSEKGTGNTDSYLLLEPANRLRNFANPIAPPDFWKMT